MVLWMIRNWTLHYLLISRGSYPFVCINHEKLALTEPKMTLYFIMVDGRINIHGFHGYWTLHNRSRMQNDIAWTFPFCLVYIRRIKGRSRFSMYGTEEVGTIYLLKESCNNITRFYNWLLLKSKVKWATAEAAAHMEFLSVDMWSSSHAIVEKHRKLSECLQLLEIRVQGCKRRPLTTGSCDHPSHYSTR
jgi:hypothetical protein